MELAINVQVGVSPEVAGLPRPHRLFFIHIILILLAAVVRHPQAMPQERGSHSRNTILCRGLTPRCGAKFNKQNFWLWKKRKGTGRH